MITLDMLLFSKLCMAFVFILAKLADGLTSFLLIGIKLFIDATPLTHIPCGFPAYVPGDPHGICVSKASVLFY
ncbi:MAG: hypothetical protein Q7R66_08960 [Undibacterium sp.]|uniref:hypothetical protein n=1 Tax=Undibacterium sp. TaxID=1914977 RepID=UPI002727EDF4|nr:hypothetical protein [Undibacterium sp.]MDO8652304.1 hypothetical protein [Undibacterium sp.]